MAKVKQTINKHRMLVKGDRVLVALSGGPDSVALLHALIEIGKEWAQHINNKKRARRALPLHIAAAHLDHAIRMDSSKDREFCRALCKRLRAMHALTLRFHSKRVNIPALARRRKISVEEAGRAARYEYFESLTARYCYTKIATGHTLDDSAETVIFNLARGAGLAGMTGIPPVRGKIVRPLINCEKSELLAFLAENKIEFRNDPTNLKSIYSRNRIRNEVMPLLHKINPGAKRNIARMAENISGELEYIRASSVSAYNLAVLKADKTKIVLDLELLERYHENLRKKIVEEGCGRLGGPATGLPSGALLRALGVIEGKSGGKAPLASGVFIEKSQGRVAIVREVARHRNIRLKVPGTTALPDYTVSLRAAIKPRDAIGKYDITNRSVFLDKQKTKDPRIRFWRQGDKIRPLGMRGHRLLSDIFIDKGIPEFERGLIPLVVSGGRIAWIAGVMVSEDFKITRQTKKVLIIELCEPS